MSYTTGNLIEASDFNNLTGGSAGANVSGQINTVWGIGRGNAGYGQTAVSNVSVGGTIAATNWASLINTVNAARKHQSGASYSNLTVPTAGTTISVISTLATQITNAYTTRLDTLAYGATSSSSKNTTINVGAGVSGTGTTNYTVTWASVDQARYFFNAGGFLRIQYVSFTNTGGTTRGTSIQTLLQTNFSFKTWGAAQAGARGGTGGTVVTDLTTNQGYYGFYWWDPTFVGPPFGVSALRINSTSYYSGDYLNINSYTTGTKGSYGDNGNQWLFTLTLFSATTGSTQPADSINVTYTTQFDIVPPAITYLTNSWGTPTIS